MNEPSPNGHIPEPDGENANGLRAYAYLGTFLEEDGWHPEPLTERHAYRCYYQGRNGELRCYAQIRTELEIFLFYAVATFKVPEDRRLSAAEFLTRANYGLRIGNFELDFNDGEVRYKSSLDFESETLTSNLIRRALYPAVETFDEYLPGLLRVVYGDKSPEEAIKEIED